MSKLSKLNIEILTGYLIRGAQLTGQGRYGDLLDSTREVFWLYSDVNHRDLVDISSKDKALQMLVENPDIDFNEIDDEINNLRKKIYKLLTKDNEIIQDNLARFPFNGIKRFIA